MAALYSSPSSIDPSTNSAVVKEEVLRHHLVPISGPLLVVSIIGLQQAGKSAFISYFTGDTAVSVGNGTDARTKGVWLYGPYSLNSLKTRWQARVVPDDQTQVIFVDTEGLPLTGFTTGSEEHRFSMMEMIGPYLFISHVSIVMHPLKDVIQTNFIDPLPFFLDVTQRICSGVNSSHSRGKGMTIIDVSCDVRTYPGLEVNERGRPIHAAYIGTPESFQRASEYLREAITQKFADQHSSFRVQVDHFWPLPFFDMEVDIFHQNSRFNRGFAVVAWRLLIILDEMRQAHQCSGERTFTALLRCVEGIRVENTVDLARICRDLQEGTTTD